MADSFYDSQEYKLKQSILTKKNWERGVFNFHYRREERVCARKNCGRAFNTNPSDPKKYCSHICSATVGNSGRILSEDVRQKISQSLTGKVSPYKGVYKTPRIETACLNINCRKKFVSEGYKKRKFCSNQCAMNVIGGRPTSPRASRGKAGIRKDISDTIYFYSRWEANVARIYTYLNIVWIYAPTHFYLGKQTYTPDFYLPITNTYVEVKNFWWKYSKERDEKFRKLYPNIKLEVILKTEYATLEGQYAKLIPTWEYKSSAFPAAS